MEPVLSTCLFIQNWLTDYGFTSREEFFTYAETSQLPVKAAKFRPKRGAHGICAGGCFITPHLLWHGTSVFLVSSEGLSHLSAFYDPQGDAEDLFCFPVHLWLNTWNNLGSIYLLLRSAVSKNTFRNEFIFFHYWWWSIPLNKMTGKCIIAHSS
jgi:hypothetical protein